MAKRTVVREVRLPASIRDYAYSYALTYFIVSAILVAALLLLGAHWYSPGVFAAASISSPAFVMVPLFTVVPPGGDRHLTKFGIGLFKDMCYVRWCSVAVGVASIASMIGFSAGVVSIPVWAAIFSPLRKLEDMAFLWASIRRYKGKMTIPGGSKVRLVIEDARFERKHAQEEDIWPSRRNGQIRVTRRPEIEDPYVDIV